MKACTTCQVSKADAEFYWRKDGSRMGRCKSCFLHAKKFREEHPGWVNLKTLEPIRLSSTAARWATRPI